MLIFFPRRRCWTAFLTKNMHSRLVSKHFREIFARFSWGFREAFASIIFSWKVRSSRNKKFNQFLRAAGAPAPPRGAAEPGPPRHAKIGKNHRNQRYFRWFFFRKGYKEIYYLIPAHDNSSCGGKLVPSLFHFGPGRDEATSSVVLLTALKIAPNLY